MIYLRLQVIFDNERILLERRGAVLLHTYFLSPSIFLTQMRMSRSSNGTSEGEGASNHVFVHLCVRGGKGENKYVMCHA